MNDRNTPGANEIERVETLPSHQRDFRSKASGNDDPPFHGREFSPRQAFRLVPFWISFTPASPCVPFSLTPIASFLFPRHRRCCSYASVPFPGRFEMSAVSDASDEDRGWRSLNRISRRLARSLPSFFAPRTSARLSDPQFCENATSTAIACPQ